MSVVITGTIADPNAPRILWDKLTGTVAASTAAALFDAVFADQPQTYTAWKPTAVPATWQITPAGTPTVNACAIGCHTLGSAGVTVFVEYLVGGDWLQAATSAPSDDSALLFLFPPVATGTAWRVRITGAVAELGVIMFGQCMVFPRFAKFAPALPITEAEQYRYNVNVTDGGSWAGRSAVSRGLDFEVSIENLSETFAAGPWAAFRAHANEGDATFFIAPKPTSYPEEVAYAWCSDTVRAQRAIANKDLSRQVDLQCSGYRALP